MQKELTLESIAFNTFDFGGQAVFYPTHQVRNHKAIERWRNAEEKGTDGEEVSFYDQIG